MAVAAKNLAGGEVLEINEDRTARRGSNLELGGHDLHIGLHLGDAGPLLEDPMIAEDYQLGVCVDFGRSHKLCRELRADPCGIAHGECDRWGPNTGVGSTAVHGKPHLISVATVTAGKCARKYAAYRILFVICRSDV